MNFPKVSVLCADEYEAEIEIIFNGFTLRVFCYPFKPPLRTSSIMLSAFCVNNIVAEKGFRKPQKINGYFSYHITAEVINTDAQLVRIGDINITLDAPIPKDIPNHTYISFDVTRLDWDCNIA